MSLANVRKERAMSSESRPKPRPDRSARSAALARINDRPKGKRSLCGSSQGQLPRPRSKVWSGAWRAPGRPSAERPSSGRTFPGRFPPEDGPSARAVLRRHGRDAARPSREPPGRPQIRRTATPWPMPTNRRAFSPRQSARWPPCPVSTAQFHEQEQDSINGTLDAKRGSRHAASGNSLA